MLKSFFQFYARPDPKRVEQRILFLVRQFRIVQPDVDHCRVLIAVAERRNEYRREIEAAVGKILGNRIHYDVELVDRIPMDPNGKTKILISGVQQPLR